ncbi:NHL domain-containing protein, partial [Chromobacterium amazonense]|uniref:NHL domain-containing protein n=1 Tax=Chromobacterium amazonense TaxID=1382803 RepID=UPI003F791B65
GQQVVLQNNGGDVLPLTANGSFTFKTPVVYGGSYAVTVAQSPAGQTCSIANASGEGAGIQGPVSTVQILCSNQSFPISGTLSGLANGQQVVLQNNGGDALALTANGSFTFKTPVVYGGSYAVTVAQSPAGQTCSIANASGEGAGIQGPVSTVQILCSNQSFPISGTLSGLANGQQVVLQNNGGDALPLTANGSFTFKTPVVYGGSYTVTVAQSPAGQTCSIANESGEGAGIQGPVSTVQILCSNQSFPISGTLSGLANGQQVVLQNNGGDALPLTANGRFTFKTPVVYGGSYDVRITMPPLGVVCTMTGNEGSVTSAVNTVQVNCGPWYVSILAGVVRTPGASNGNGDVATFQEPYGIAVDKVGNVFVADTRNNLIRKISPSGVVSTFAGTGSCGDTNGTGTNAAFCNPVGITIDANGNLYVADYLNDQIRMITPAGVVSTFAGSGDAGLNNGMSSAATFNLPSGVAADRNGNVFVADSRNNVIRKISSSGVVSTFAGAATCGNTNGIGTEAAFCGPIGITIDANGNLYIVDSANALIRMITLAGVVSTFAGSGGTGLNNGMSGAATFNNPFGVAVDGNGNVYIADTQNNCIRQITPNGSVSTLAGSGRSGSANGLASTASFLLPTGVAVDIGGNLYVADKGNQLIRKIGPLP